MGATGFEPVTSSASRKRSSPELSAPVPMHARRRPESNRCSSFCRAVPNHSATSPYTCAGRFDPVRPGLGAEDGTRTRDLNLGKVALYQLSYFRVPPHCSVCRIPSGCRSPPYSLGDRLTPRRTESLRATLGLIQSINRPWRRERDRYDHQLGDPVPAGDTASLPTVIDQHHPEFPAIAGIYETRGVDQPYPVPARQPATGEHQPRMASRYGHRNSGIDRRVLSRLQPDGKASIKVKPRIGRVGACGRR